MATRPDKRWVAFFVFARGTRYTKATMGEDGKLHPGEPYDFWSPLPNGPVAPTKEAAEEWAKVHATGFDWRVQDGCVVIP